jgi:hypothetical protein
MLAKPIRVAVRKLTREDLDKIFPGGARQSCEMRLTHEQRQVFRMLANARRPSGRSGTLGPLLLSERRRKLALRLAGIGEESGATGPLASQGTERFNAPGVPSGTIASQVA